MRLVLITVLLEAFLVALFPNETVALLILGGVAVFLAIVSLRQEALIVTPLLLALPLVALMVNLTVVRLLGIVVVLALVLLALSDIAHRHRGAPLSFSRLLLWYLGGAFFLMMALFAFVATKALDSSFVVVVAVLIGAGGLYLGRTAAERARAVELHRVPRVTDAWIVGLMIAEIVVAVSYLPFNAVPLAAFVIIALWLLIRTVVLSRLGQLRLTNLLQLSASAAVTVAAVALPAILF